MLRCCKARGWRTRGALGCLTGRQIRVRYDLRLDFGGVEIESVTGLPDSDRVGTDFIKHKGARAQCFQPGHESQRRRF